MFFCITFGTHEFTGQLKGYENVNAQCHNCGNWTARGTTRWPWFTVCFVPIVPLALGKHEELSCHICRYRQKISQRPDVQSQQNQPEGAPQGGPPPPVAYGGAAPGQPQPQPGYK